MFQIFYGVLPKTEKSNRLIPLDDKTILSLKRWKATQREYLFKLGYTQPKFIFTHLENKFTDNQAITERLTSYRDRTDLPRVTQHCFRHTHASMLFAAGVDIKEVSERLGHSNIKTTLDTYIHLTEKQQEKNS